MNSSKAIPFFLFIVFLNFTSVKAIAGPLDTLQPGQWFEIPNSKIRPYLPSPVPPGTSGPSSITTAWNGGFFDSKRNRYVVMGGGHGDYAGNELYGFNLDTLQWSRIWGPTPNAQIPAVAQGGTETYQDGNPASRHTYSGIQYLTTVDKYFVHGGSLWGGSGGMGLYSWYFDPTAGTWTQRANISTCYGGHAVPFTAYDANTGITYAHKYNSLCEYNPMTNAWRTRGGHGAGTSPMATSVFDSKRKQFCLIGGGATLCYDIASTASSIPLQAIATTGDKSAENASYPGTDYDPISDKVVAWIGGTDVYTLDLTTKVWSKRPAASGNTVTPTAPTHTGTHTRWRYIPSKNIFIVVNSIDQNVYVYKLSSGTGTLPPPPPPITTAPNSPSNLQLAGVATPPPPPPTDNTAPSVPTGLTAQPVSSSQINLSWTASTDNMGVTGYTVFRNAAQIATVTTNSYQNTALASSTTYSFTVAARDAAGNQSAQSSVVSATTQAISVPPPSSPPPSGQVSIPTRQWVAYELPNLPAIPLHGGAKHLTSAVNPRDGRIYMVGGDYNLMGGSYVQQVISLSLKERLASPTNRNAGWRLDHTYCDGPGNLTPKHPDFVGWFWDERIGKFWYVPGTEVLADNNCQGETALNQSDPKFSWGRMLHFDPTTGVFTDAGEAGVGHLRTWWSTLDPVKNRILRPWYSGSNGSNLDIYDIATKTWATRQLGPYNSLGGEVHLEHGYHVVDRVRRYIYATDGRRFYRFSMDTPLNERGVYALEDLGVVPHADNEAKMFFDPYSRVILFPSNDTRSFYAYHVDTAQWENLGNNIANNGFVAAGKVLFYDEINNVLGWFGQSDPSPNLASMPYLFLYRYAPPSGK